MTRIIGTEYGRGCLATAINGGPALATKAVQKMFPNADWSVISADKFDAKKCADDRFGENFEIQKKIYAQTPTEKHIFIGGDHSVNFGHFTALSDQLPDSELCLIYMDAHFDIHTPESAITQASGAPHGTNVRALLGSGDSRWLTLPRKKPSLKPENLFFLGVRSFEPAEVEFVRANNIFWRDSNALNKKTDLDATISEIRKIIAGRPFVVSLDFDVIDSGEFNDVLVPETVGISTDTAEFLVNEFRDAYGFEFVEYAPSGDKKSEIIVQKLIGIVESEF